MVLMSSLKVKSVTKIMDLFLSANFIIRFNNYSYTMFAVILFASVYIIILT